MAQAAAAEQWDLEKQRSHVSDGAHQSFVLQDQSDSEKCVENTSSWSCEEATLQNSATSVEPTSRELHASLSQLSLSAIESREVDAAKVKLLLQIKARSQDQELAADRRKASSSYLGKGRTVGDRESKDIIKLRRNLNQKVWKKSATTGNAEPLLRARRDVELCEAVQKDMALCTTSAQAPALLWASMPPKNARRLGSLDMFSKVLPQVDTHFRKTPVAQDLETLKRVTFLGPDIRNNAALVESYVGAEGQPGMPTGLSHTISQKVVGDIDAKIQVSPFVAVTVHLPRDGEAFRHARAMWPAASGIGSLGPSFGTSRSLFELKAHGIQEAEMFPENAYDVATLAKCTDYSSVEEMARPAHPHSTDGLQTISPQNFGIRTFTSHPDNGVDSPAHIRSPERTGRPMGFDMMMEVTDPQHRSPRQHRRALNLERGPNTHDEKHRMARSIASFRDIVPSTILDVTSNFQEFYPAAKETTSQVARAAALPFVVTNNSLWAPNNAMRPGVYYIGDGIVSSNDLSAKSKTEPKSNEEMPTLPPLTGFAPPIFSVNGNIIPSTAVAERKMPKDGRQMPRQNKSTNPVSPMTSVDSTSRPCTGLTSYLHASIALTRPGTQDQLRPFTPVSPWFTVPTTPVDPSESGVVFINKVGDVNQQELDAFYPHFQEFTIGRRIERRHGGSAQCSTPRNGTPLTEISFPSASSVTRHLKSSDTVREIRTANLQDWTVPRTPLPQVDPPRDPLRPPIVAKMQSNQQQSKFSPPRTPQMEFAEPSSHVRKADPLRDLLEAREGFKAQKEALMSVDVVLDEGGHGCWDTQTMWCVGGMLIFESEPLHQTVSVWQPAKRGMAGHYANQLINESKLTRACHVDEVILLQERALQERPFALDIVIAEIHATFKSKFIWKRGLTGLRAERGDFLRVYRAKDSNSIYAEYQGYPGVVPSSAIEVSKKVTKKSLTMAFHSLAQLQHCVSMLQKFAPYAGLKVEPRTALLNAFGREGISKRNSRESRLALQAAFAHAYNRMAELRELMEQEHGMLQAQGDKTVMMGLPQRQVMAKDLKNLPVSAISNVTDNATKPHSDELFLVKEELSDHSASSLAPKEKSPHRARRATLAGPPMIKKPLTPTSPLSRRRRNTQPELTAYSRPKQVVKRGVCAVCEKHGQCLISVPKYCNRCALKSVYDSLNKGDLREATVSCHHLEQLVYHNQPVQEVTVGEQSALQTRCNDARARVQEAARLNNLRDFFRASHCGDVTRIMELAVAGVDVKMCVENMEWVPHHGFMTTRSVALGFSAVHYACMAFTGLEGTEGKKAALIKLVDHFELDPHLPALDGRLPMHIAVNELPCLNFLIFSKGGNPEWRDGDGRTVLHHAAMYGGLECRIFLIGVCEMDHTVKDRFNKTPADYNEDVLLLVSKKRSLKMICAFFKNAIVMKCFYIMKRHKKEPHYMLKFVPTEERKQNIVLAARITRRRLYRDWQDHGHPRLLKPWSSLLHEKSELSLKSELSQLSSLEWSNALEWSWYIGHDSASCLSPIDEPLWEVWCGDSTDFTQDRSLVNLEADFDLNMTMAEHGKSLTVSEFAVHYDAKVVYRLETRPPTSEAADNGRIRTPKDIGMRTIKPNIKLQPDGCKPDDVDTSQAGSLWSRVGSFTRSFSFTRAVSSRSHQQASTVSAQVSKGGSAASTEFSAAGSFARTFSFMSSKQQRPPRLAASDIGMQESMDATAGEQISVSGEHLGSPHLHGPTCLPPLLPLEGGRNAAALHRVGAQFMKAIIPPSASD